MSKWSIACALVLAFCGVSLDAQGKTTLTGVWKFVERDGKPVLGESLYIFTPRYYCRIHTYEQTRPAFQVPEKPTPDEMATAFNTLAAGCGTYEIVGDRLILNVILSKFPGEHGPSPQARRLNVERDSFMILEEVQGQSRTYKFTRLE